MLCSLEHSTEKLGILMPSSSLDDYEPVLSLLSAFLASLSIAVGVCFPIDKTTSKYYIADEMKIARLLPC